MGHYNPKNDVILRLEFITASQTKVGASPFCTGTS